jgi:hypothetical protein
MSPETPKNTPKMPKNAPNALEKLLGIHFLAPKRLANAVPAIFIIKMARF